MAGASPGNELAVMIEPVLDSMGYELVDLEFGSGGLLRVVIDIVGGERHVQVEDCEKVSHQLGRLFMVEEVDYDRLEVSSPGLDRPLKKAADFARFAGEKVTLRMRVPIEGRRQFTGVLRRGDDPAVVLKGSDAPEGAKGGIAPVGAKGEIAPVGAKGEIAPVGAKGDDAPEVARVAAGVPAHWVLYWSDEPAVAPGRKGAKGAKGFKGAKTGKSGKGVAKAGMTARGGKAAGAMNEEQPQGQRLEFTLDQIEKARLVPKLVF